MRILFLATEIFNGLGGIQVFNNHLISTLINLGHNLSVVSINDSKSPGNTNYLFSPCGKCRYLRKPTFIINALKQIFCFKPNLILCGHLNFSLLCMVLSKIFKMPYFTIIHGIEVWNPNRLKILGLKHSKKILCVSNFLKNKILKQLPDCERNDIFILPNTFDAQRFRPRPKPKYIMDRFNLKENDRILLTITRLSKRERYKGYDKVIIAVKEIVKEFPNAKYIIGGSGDDEERIRILIRDNGLEDKVILTGFIPPEELVDYYNLCDVFVMPSKGEGFGIVFLEALACGKPVVAGNQNGSSDALLGGRLGLLVDPDDIHQIVEAIVKILRGDVDNRLLDANFLRQKVIENFGLENFYRRISEFLNTIKNEI